MIGQFQALQVDRQRAWRVSAQLGCQTITIEQPFDPAIGVLAGCPTAEALKRRYSRMILS